MLVTRIIAVRHGETDWNAATRIQGQTDIRLNQKGLWQAQRAAQALATGDTIDAIYSSDLARAHATAQCIGQASAVAVLTDDRLRERAFGRFEGHTFSELEAGWPHDTLRWRARDPDWSPPEGESLLAFQQRVVAATQTLAERHRGELIVLVAHGGVLDILYRAANRLAIDASRTWTLGNASINRLLWSSQGLSMVGWSDSAHLADSPRHEAIS